jgi:hypothetical protein
MRKKGANRVSSVWFFSSALSSCWAWTTPCRSFQPTCPLCDWYGMRIVAPQSRSASFFISMP